MPTSKSSWQCSAPGCTRELPTCRRADLQTQGQEPPLRQRPMRLRWKSTGEVFCVEFALYLIDAAKVIIGAELEQLRNRAAALEAERAALNSRGVDVIKL